MWPSDAGAGVGGAEELVGVMQGVVRGAGCVDRRSYERVKGRNHSVEEAINTHPAQIRCNQPATVCCVDREVR